MRKFTLLLLLLVVAHVLSAQNIVKSLQSNVPGQGKVTIHQDPAIEALIGSEHTVSADGTATSSSAEHRILKGTGYRIQVYAGTNSRAARTEATNMGNKVKDLFPEMKVYTFFSTPRWLCRVGDFRSIEEADAMMRKLRSTGGFKEVTIVKDHINIHL